MNDEILIVDINGCFEKIYDKLLRYIYRDGKGFSFFPSDLPSF
jgi:hypothetical protein